MKIRPYAKYYTSKEVAELMRQAFNSGVEKGDADARGIYWNSTTNTNVPSYYKWLKLNHNNIYEKAKIKETHK